MSDCPFCDYQTPEPDGGDRRQQAWQEVAHMQAEHADVIAARLGEDVFASVRFSDAPERQLSAPLEPAALRVLAEASAATVSRRNQDELRQATTGSYLIAAAILDAGATLAAELRRIADELEYRR